MKRGFAVVELVVILALLAGGVWVAKPALFGGASKRAATSTATTNRLLAATNDQGSTAAASLAQIGAANSAAPESPSRSFIGQEVPLAMTLLPPPDAGALIAAERRKTAIMEGRVDEARKLYEVAAKNASQLQHERDAAISAKRVSDLALEQSAAAEHARTVQAAGIGLIALLALAAWGWAKLNGVSPHILGNILHDIRSGEDAARAFDAHLPNRLHKHVAKARKLAAP